MNWPRRTLLASAAAYTADWLHMPLFAQPARGMPVVGILQLGTAEPLATWVDAVRNGLRQQGLIDGAHRVC